MVAVLASDTFALQSAAPSGVSLAAPLEIFTPAQVQVTALAGWPAGRTVKEMSLQGTNAYGYVRRSWKPSNVGWLDIIPGWRPTSAAETLRLVLDNGALLDVSYQVAATIPAPTGSGVTRYLDASAAAGGNGTSGSPWNSWATAIGALTAGSVLVVRARAGTRTINGRAIPNFVYPVDVGGVGTVTSTVSNVTIYADPVDLAAGRRPRIHVNGSDLAGFYDDPNGMWEADPSDPSGNVWRTTRSTYPETHSQNIWWRGSTGRISGGYAYYSTTGGNGESSTAPAPSFLNQLRDTTYLKQDMWIGRRNWTYVGPGITWNSGRYYVRLSPPPLSTVVQGAFTTYPWYWTDYFPPGTNPNTTPLYVSTSNDGGTGNSCLTITSTSNWQIYNLDFICGHFGIVANSTSGFHVWGCRFIGASQGDHPSTDNGNTLQGKQIKALGATNFLADHCAFYGGCPPWFMFTEGKGWCGSHGTGLRNGAYDFSSTTGVSRHCYYEGFFSLMLFNDQTELRWHHCSFLNVGQQDGFIVVNAPSSIFEIIRCQLLGCTITGWAGSHANPGPFHLVGNLWSMYLPNGGSHKALHQKNTLNGSSATSGGPATALDCDFTPPPSEQPHGGTGGGEPKRFQFQNSIIGTQCHRQASISPGYGTGAILSPHRPNQLFENGFSHNAQNNIAAVYPTKNGYLWASSDPAVGARDSFSSILTTHALAIYDYNHFFRHGSMPNTGRSSLLTVGVYNGSGTDCATIAAAQARGVEAHGSSGDIGWTISYPETVSDKNFYDPANFLVPLGNPAASGGNTGLSGQGAHDYDINTQITYPGYYWRGCMVPGVPAIEQEVGPMGPMIA